jgi:hypothetical protein
LSRKIAEPKFWIIAAGIAGALIAILLLRMLLHLQ